MSKSFRTGIAFLGSTGALLLTGPLCAQSDGSWPTRPLPAAQGLAILVQAYPDQLSEFRNGQLVWKDGTVMDYQQHSSKQESFEDFLNDADLADQLAQPYLLTNWKPPPSDLSDPGRARCLAFFKKMYGATSTEVESHLAAVRWMPSLGSQTVRITRVNGIDQKLAAVVEELSRLPVEVQRRFLIPSAGAFFWRPIAGTERLSMHSFGAAIDLNADLSDYWRWTKPDANGRYRYRNQIPAEIVEIFEKHGFIWGGKWYHYDTMHFEYRPELILAAQRPQR